MAKKKKLSLGFLIFYILFVAILVGFWVWFINAVIIKDLNIYENSQAKYYMEEVAAKVQAGDLSGMDFGQSSSRFEDPDIYKNNFANSLQGKTITFEESPVSYDAQAPVFELYADGTHIATVNLKSTSSESLMFILTVQTWTVDGITPIYECGNEGVKITIPSIYTAYVNGIQLDERELVGEPSDYMELEYVKNYVAVPQEITYAVSGLMTTPSVKVCDASGNEVQTTQDGTVYTADFNKLDPPEDIAQAALTNAKNISEVYAGDRTLTAIKPLFTEDSYFIPLFQEYINHDLWMYNNHDTPSYANESVSNYVKYSDELYSIEVYYEKTMYLPKRNMTKTDKAHNTFYYVLIDGKWLIADMISMGE